MKQGNLFKNREVLVTGGAGFVGTNLILKLLESDARITVTIHEKPPQIRDKHIKFIRGDLREKKFCKKVTANKDYVFMCAANTSGAAVIEKTPLDHVTPNIIMNALMLEASYEARVKKFLFISSSTVYPPFSHAVREDEVMKGEPFEKYFAVAWMKRYSEILCEIYARKIKQPMPVIVVRPGNLYGPFDDFDFKTSHAIPALIKRVVNRDNPIVVWGDGRDVKDLIFIDDFIEGMMRAMEKIFDFGAVNIASGRSVSLRDVLKMILEIENFKDAKIKFDSTKPTMIKKRLIDVSLAKSLLDFEVKTSIHDGLTKTIDWYKHRVLLK